MEVVFRCGFTDNIDSVVQELRVSVDEDFKDFLTTFYTEALAGMLINYFQGDERRSRQEWIDYILLTLKKSIPNVLCEKSRMEAEEKA